jgi:hypothetical protein
MTIINGTILETVIGLSFRAAARAETLPARTRLRVGCEAAMKDADPQNSMM